MGQLLAGHVTAKLSQVKPSGPSWRAGSEGQLPQLVGPDPAPGPCTWALGHQLAQLAARDQGQQLAGQDQGQQLASWGQQLAGQDQGPGTRD